MTADTTARQDERGSAAVDARLARNGKVSYIQIPALDVDRSAGFYASVFGWKVRADTNPTHRSFDDTSGDLIGAWVTNLSPARDPGVLPYIYVTRIDATLEQVKANGGEIVRAPYPEGDLWVATLRDPAGNVIGVWQAGPR